MGTHTETEKGAHGDRVPQMGTHMGAVHAPAFGKHKEVICAVSGSLPDCNFWEEKLLVDKVISSTHVLLFHINQSWVTTLSSSIMADSDTFFWDKSFTNTIMNIIFRADHYRFLTWLVMKLVTIMSTLLFKLIWTLSHLMKLVK